jgi:FkbM family methyltransferase
MNKYKQILSKLVTNKINVITRSLSSSNINQIEKIEIRLNENTLLGQKGDLIYLRLDEVITPKVLTNGAWEPEIINILKKFIRRDQKYIFFDIGCNIGLTSRQILNSFDNIDHSFHVEPSKKNIEIAKLNLSKFKNTIFVNKALAQKSGKEILYKNSVNYGNYSLDSNSIQSTQYEEEVVEIENINDFFSSVINQHNFKIIIKSDTEGFDYKLLSFIDDKILAEIEIYYLEISNKLSSNELDLIYNKLGDFNIYNEKLKKINNTIEVFQNEIMSYKNNTDIILVRK